MFPGEKHIIKATKDESLIVSAEQQGKVQFGSFISESVRGTVVENSLKKKKAFFHYSPLFNSLNRFSINFTRQLITNHKQLLH